MKELVVISGKGGTGKTSVTAAFAALADRPVIADCDVDAADLHLVLSPRVRERHDFYSGHEAVVRREECVKCGACLAHCRFDAVKMDGARAGEATFSIDPALCEGCGVCVRFCPVNAIDFPERLCGEWMVSDTDYGPMAHACLNAAAENSGKLVATVRREAKNLAEADNHPLVLVDGPPGIGCPVIASITGASLVLAVTEPTVSGEHDLERVLALTKHFKIPAAVCVNKWDINEAMTEAIEAKARDANAIPAGRIRYDVGVTTAQVMGQPVVVFPESVAAQDMQTLWKRIQTMLS
ncbi:MAG TPA: 4Fe-4S dicluster domain-containing protein [Candidatus Hydrogenedentes bacterium]|nr:4Fe-4S dicluster domain-containing protein [Candidatus Hydrogenedentota bacterium]